jgi:hypothetical protein
MQLRRHLTFALATAVLACGGDRPTAPLVEAERAASELERAAAELGLGADPSAALTYQSVAAAIRGGAPVAVVKITADGRLEEWFAFGHEIQFEPTTAATPADLPIEFGLRALLAWRAPQGGPVQVLHLTTSGNEGPIGQFAPIDPVDGTLTFPSTLMYSEGRNLFWEATRGYQWSSARATSTPCPGPRRTVAGAAAPKCVLATFKFRFADVEAEPFSFPFAPPGSVPSAATGKRALSMGEHTIDGMRVTIDLRTIGDLPGRVGPTPDSLPVVGP